MLSGSVEINPGPRVKYPCGQCKKPVKFGKSIACDACQYWYHLECSNIGTEMYECYSKHEDLQWICLNCGIPSVNTSLFNSSVSSLESESSDEQVSPKRKSRMLRIAVINFQGIWGKKELFAQCLLDCKADIVIGSETFLDPSIKNCEVLPPGFTAYRIDRNDGWGGAIIICKSSLITDIVFKSKETECIAIKVETYQRPVIICSVYRPTNNDTNYLNLLANDLNTLRQKYKTNPIWIGGDFNLPDIDWKNSTTVSHQYSKEINDTFLNLTNECNLVQLINFPTRKDNILDILLTNNSSLLSSISNIPGISDHTAIPVVDILCHPSRQKLPKRKVHLWNRADIPVIKAMIQQKVEEFCLDNQSNSSTIDTQWSDLKDIFNSALASVPSKCLSQRFNQPWITTECKRLSKRKKRLYKRAKRTNLDTDWSKFKEINKSCKKSCRKAYNCYINEKIINSNNPKKFYSFIKSKRQDNVNVAPLKRGETYIIDDKEKANMLNDQYCSVFSKQSTESPPINAPKSVESIDNIDIEVNGVSKLLKNLQTHKATGPDCIPARFLNEFSNEIAPALTLLYRNSLSQGTVPSEWLHAFIVPVYKGGNKERSSPENYRPISLTSICCKTMEHIIYSSIMNHLNENDILSDVQHGFRSNRSCETQLLITTHDFVTALNNGKQMDSILLDFSKAFDKVNHHKLCNKLDHYGIRGKCLQWIRSFLTGRTQQVVLGGSLSNKADVLSGVPQGTVLGPLLFLIYINDLPSYVNSTIRLFADDAYLYNIIDSVNDSLLLQSDLDNLQLWEKYWDMEFHPQKCKTLTITNKTKPITTTYSIHNEQLESVANAKYLGVILNKKMRWNTHIAAITKKANQQIMFLQRNLRECPKNLKASAYKVYVKPILMYASSVWNPTGTSNQGLRIQIDRVQRKAARFVNSNWSWESSTTSMIKDLKWKSLEFERKVNSLVMLHKIIHNKVAIPHSVLPSRSRDNIKFRRVYGRVNAYANSFIPSTVFWWNELPREILSLVDQCLFKDEIIKFSENTCN